MKVLCTQENLNRGINIVERIVGRSGVLPILTNILLETEGGRLKLASTNLEIGINCWIGGKIEKQGGLTIPVKIISNFVSSLPNKRVELWTKDNTLYLKCENYRANIKGVDIKEFPLIPKIKEKPIFILKAQDFKEGASQVVSAASQSESRPEISGVFMGFNPNSNRMRLAATDSYRLAEKDVGKSKSDIKNAVSAIIPARTIFEVIRILSEEEGELKITLTEGQVLFELNNVNLVSRLIEGQYPDYKQIIPQGFKTRVLVDREELIKAVKVASFFTGKVNDIKVKVPGKGKKIEVSGLSAEVGENVSEVKSEIEGEPVIVTFNHRYLLDGLNNITTSRVALELNGDNNPGVLKPVDRQDYIYLIMPIKT